MFKKGHKHSEEIRQKISKNSARRGKPAWNKGEKQSFELIEKRIAPLRGRKRPPFSEEWKKNISKGSMGKKLSEETKKKLSETHKGKMPKFIPKNGVLFKRGFTPWNKNKKETRIEVIKKMSEKQKGNKSYLWKGGISLENKRIRHGFEFRLWRESVFTRDNFACKKCGIESGCGYKIYLHPHHILNFAQFPELRFAIDNGITFCDECHWEFHKIYGKYNNTKEQLEEFINI
jgi:hypothetical protein